MTLCAPANRNPLGSLLAPSGIRRPAGAETETKMASEVRGVIIETVGDDVVGVAPGDFVVLNWRAVCGTCRACRRGRPWYCFSTHNATQPMTLQDWTPLSPALGVGAFAEKTLVDAGPW